MTVRVAVVGAGRWGPNLIANFHNLARSEVRWVVDRDPQRLGVVRERFPEIEVAEALDRVLADPALDAVVIAAPTRSHRDLAGRALEAGKHVLVEKPMADNVEDADALCQLASRSGRVLLVGHVFLYNEAARHAKQVLVRGELGRIYYIAMLRTNLGPIRIDVNAAWDLAAHDISLASYWLESAPLTVSATGGAWINAGIEDAVFATLRYPDDVLVNLHASWLHPRKSREITVVGDKRMLTFDDTSPQEPLRIYDKHVKSERSSPHFVDSFESFRMSVADGSITIPAVPMSEPLRNECEHFLDCILDGAEPISGPEEGLAVVRSLEALSRSIRESGREVEVGS